MGCWWFVVEWFVGYIFCVFELFVNCDLFVGRGYGVGCVCLWFLLDCVLWVVCGFYVILFGIYCVDSLFVDLLLGGGVVGGRYWCVVVIWWGVGEFVGCGDFYVFC